MINYDHVGHNIRKFITVTEFRRHMAHYIAMVRYGDDYVCIKRRGQEPVFLVSHADWDLIQDRRNELQDGSKDEKGHRSGWGLMYFLRVLIKAEHKGSARDLQEVKNTMEAVDFGAPKPHSKRDDA